MIQILHLGIDESSAEAAALTCCPWYCRRIRLSPPFTDLACVCSAYCTAIDLPFYPTTSERRGHWAIQKYLRYSQCSQPCTTSHRDYYRPVFCLGNLVDAFPALRILCRWSAGSLLYSRTRSTWYLAIYRCTWIRIDAKPPIVPIYNYCLYQRIVTLVLYRADYQVLLRL